MIWINMHNSRDLIFFSYCFLLLLTAFAVHRFLLENGLVFEKMNSPLVVLRKEKPSSLRYRITLTVLGYKLQRDNGRMVYLISVL
jgi:hypothetical protein